MSARKPDKSDTKQPRKPGAKARRDWKPKFLQALRESANVRAACEKAKINRQHAYDARKSDPDFAAQWDAAEEDACDLLELEARRRAYKGTDKPIVYQGIVHSTYKEYSDALLMFLLRSHRPSKYREQQWNYNLDVSKLTDEQLERIARGEDARVVIATPGASGEGTPATAEPQP